MAALRKRTPHGFRFVSLLRLLAIMLVIAGLNELAFADKRETPVRKLLDTLNEQNHNKDRFKYPWLKSMKEIVELGPDVVPDLVVELDNTNDEWMLRCLAFILRAINDKRAIPALI